MVLDQGQGLQEECRLKCTWWSNWERKTILPVLKGPPEDPFNFPLPPVLPVITANFQRWQEGLTPPPPSWLKGSFGFSRTKMWQKKKRRPEDEEAGCPVCSGAGGHPRQPRRRE